MIGQRRWGFMPKKVKNTAVKPECFADEIMLDVDSEVCVNCDVYIPCMVETGYGADYAEACGRKAIEEEMASHNVAYADAVKAITSLFPTVTENAAGLAYTRKVQKYRRKYYE
jgi:hypothetical protein